MTVQEWGPGQLVQPGDLRRPVAVNPVGVTQFTNSGFEAATYSDTYTLSGGTPNLENEVGAPKDNVFLEGAQVLHIAHGGGASFIMRSDDRLACTPGQLITLRCYVRCTGSYDETRAQNRIYWYNSGGAQIGVTNMAQDPTFVSGALRVDSQGLVGLAARDVWVEVETFGVAPANAASFTWGMGFYMIPGGYWEVDDIRAVYSGVPTASSLLFQATQSEAGYTDTAEPDWPTSVGQTVVDNEVTWTAIAGNNVTWEATRILVSDSSEPTWPTTAPGSVLDNTIQWELDTRRVRDSNIPQSKIATIAARKVYTGDDDIIRFSATNNPLDLTSELNAGFIPFGLQPHGANPVTGLAVYRGNLAAANSEAIQIWQADPDPTAIVLLDSIPIGCSYSKTMKPVGNDMAFLSDVGIRNLGTVGASVNLEAGYFGKPVDPIVKALKAAAIAAGFEPHAFYWPARGQYWCIFEGEAVVLTISGDEEEVKRRSWSRYVFPSDIDEATLAGEELYLRSGDLVWQVDDDATQDDVDLGGGEGGTDADFRGAIQFPHMNLGSAGRNKLLVGLDLIGAGAVDIQIGFDQRYQDAAGGDGWTSAYTIAAADTMVGTMIPFPCNAPSFALRLEFAADQAWSFESATLYVNDQRQGS